MGRPQIWRWASSIFALRWLQHVSLVCPKMAFLLHVLLGTTRRSVCACWLYCRAHRDGYCAIM